MAKAIHICCGVGGVGKTTAAAALAVGLARQGKRVAVMTIDPARRLADALGVELSNDPQAVRGVDGLWALMLDRKQTFDQVVRRYAPDGDTGDRLIANRYYNAVSTRLSGSQEYMAMEKLLALDEDPRFDTIVVDTPPTRHALDFLRAPERVRSVLDKRVLGAVVNPTGGGLFSRASKRVLGVVYKMAGDSVLKDLQEFFGLLGGLSQGFRDRGAKVRTLLGKTETLYWLVLGANDPGRDDAFEFLDTLKAEKLHIGGILVNRVTPVPNPDVVPDLPTPPGVDPTIWSERLEALRTRHHESVKSVKTQEAALSEVDLRSGAAPMLRIADRPDGVQDLSDLAEIGDAIVASIR